MFNRIIKFNPRTLYNRYTVRVILYATLSALIAYNIALAFQGVFDPTIAGVMALTGIKSTFHDTVEESVKKVVGTSVGSILSVFFIAWLGFNNATFIIIIVASFIIGWVIRLKIEGSLTIAAMVLLVNSPSLIMLDDVWQRIAGVVLGAMFALLASMLIIQANPHKNVLNHITSLSKSTHKLMKAIAKKFTTREELTVDEVSEWFNQIETIIAGINDSREQVNALMDDAKWSPLISKKDVENVLMQARIAKRNAGALQSIIQSIKHHMEKDWVLQPKVSQRIGQLMYETAEVMKKQNKLAVSEPAEWLPKEEITALRQQQSKVVETMKNMDNTEALLFSGTLLHEITNIRRTISK